MDWELDHIHTHYTIVSQFVNNTIHHSFYCINRSPRRWILSKLVEIRKLKQKILSHLMLRWANIVARTPHSLTLARVFETTIKWEIWLFGTRKWQCMARKVSLARLCPSNVAWNFPLRCAFLRIARTKKFHEKDKMIQARAICSKDLSTYGL